MAVRRNCARSSGRLKAAVATKGKPSGTRNAPMTSRLLRTPRYSSRPALAERADTTLGWSGSPGSLNRVSMSRLRASRTPSPRRRTMATWDTPLTSRPRPRDRASGSMETTPTPTSLPQRSRTGRLTWSPQRSPEPSASGRLTTTPAAAPFEVRPHVFLITDRDAHRARFGAPHHQTVAIGDADVVDAEPVAGGEAADMGSGWHGRRALPPPPGGRAGAAGDRARPVWPRSCGAACAPPWLQPLRRGRRCSPSRQPDARKR